MFPLLQEKHRKELGNMISVFYKLCMKETLLYYPLSQNFELKDSFPKRAHTKNMMSEKV